MTRLRNILMSGAASALLAVVVTPAYAADDLPECLDKLNENWRSQRTVLDNMSASEREDLRTLRDAAVILGRADEDEACREVGDSIDEMLEDKRDKLVDQGVVLERDREARVEALADAKPIGAMGLAVPASRLIGVEVRNFKDEELGEVDDVIVDGATNNISYLLIERGGFLGIGDDLVAVPANMVSVTADFETMVLPVSEDRLDEAPTVDDRKLLDDPQWKNRNDAFFKESKTESLDTALPGKK